MLCTAVVLQGKRLQGEMPPLCPWLWANSGFRAILVSGMLLMSLFGGQALLLDAPRGIHTRGCHMQH
jgi:hypothetical protein